MKYTGKSLKYVFANFGYLILFGLFPAVFLAYSLDSATVGRILGDFFSGEPLAKFSEIFRAVSIFNFRSPTAVLSEGLGVALTVDGAENIWNTMGTVRIRAKKENRYTDEL